MVMLLEGRHIHILKKNWTLLVIFGICPNILRFSGSLKFLFCAPFCKMLFLPLKGHIFHSSYHLFVLKIQCCGPTTVKLIIQFGICLFFICIQNYFCYYVWTMPKHVDLAMDLASFSYST